MVTEIKTYPRRKKEFTANGRRYIVHETLTIRRVSDDGRIKAETETGTTTAELVKRLEEQL